MTPTQLLLAIRARWLTLGSVLLLCVGAGLALVLLLKPQYTVNATVMLDMKTADPIGGAVIPALGISNYMSTQADLIRSSRVVERALKARKADENAEADADWRRDTGGQGSKMAWLAARAQKNLLVTASRESNMISLAFTGGDAQEATDFLQALLDAYIATSIDLRTDAAGRNTTFFEEHLRQLRSSLAQAQEKLSGYQRDAGVLANDERLDVENARLTELSNQLLTLQIAEVDSGSRKQAAKGQIDSTQEALGNPVVGGMTADLARQEARLSELTSRLGEKHPDVQQARANIAALKTRLDDELHRLGNSLGIANSVHATRVAQLRQAYDAQRDKVARLKAMRDQTAVLQRDVENANQAYSDTAARARQASMESQASLSNASVVMAPTLPVKPSRPRPLLTLVLATAVGLLLGLAAAVLRELTDRRLRSEDDVLLLLGQPSLGLLPEQAGPAGRRGLLGFLTPSPVLGTR
ncbi:MAG: chain length determinant protein EpsF [Roseateles depolymerans]|uniref:Chain length determinant protein EpsF n=1 Tax=Roseateles depolymerans TaxID=76731 RepID=A0A2W5FRA4_9BURK|nr:MAG: chain length determinant protein EpsF [Roseateles depolymerans]